MLSRENRDHDSLDGIKKKKKSEKLSRKVLPGDLEKSWESCLLITCEALLFLKKRHVQRRRQTEHTPILLVSSGVRSHLQHRGEIEESVQGVVAKTHGQNPKCAWNPLHQLLPRATRRGNTSVQMGKHRAVNFQQKESNTGRKGKCTDARIQFRILFFSQDSSKGINCPHYS